MTSDFSGQKCPFTNCTFKLGSLEEAFVASWWIRNRVAAPLHMLDVTNVKLAPTTVTAPSLLPPTANQDFRRN